MSVLGDTIRDAHRPLPDGGKGWLPPEECTESRPEGESDPSGRQTGFSFQKEGQSLAAAMPREASFRSEETLTDDPLSVESEVEKPNVSASGVNGDEDIFTVMGENRGNELATGQVNHGSPGWTTAVEMSSETRTHQPEVTSEPIESDCAHQRQKSREQHGSARRVSEQEETYQSRVPGQGAPSESFTAPINPLRSESPGPTPVGRPPVPGRILWPAEAAPGSAVEPAGTASDEADPAMVRPGGEPVVPQTTAIGSPFAQGFSTPRRSAQSESGAITTASGPQLVIGRIDVVVVKESQPAARPFSSRQSDSGFVSRNYLKRL